MGIDNDGWDFLQYARRIGVDFSTTCTIGRQHISADSYTGHGAYADRALESLGATELEALDYSDFEGAVIIHDLNSPTLPRSPRKYSAVLDCGTLEHIFNAPNGLRAICSLADIGGHIILIHPANGNVGHGFYQFTQEFYYGALQELNGFQIRECLFKERGLSRNWYRIPNPSVTRHRSTFGSACDAYFFVIAERVSDALPGDAGSIIQPDYSESWDKGVTQQQSGGHMERIPATIRPSIRRAIITARGLAGPHRQGFTRVRL